MLSALKVTSSNGSQATCTCSKHVEIGALSLAVSKFTAAHGTYLSSLPLYPTIIVSPGIIPLFLFLRAPSPILEIPNSSFSSNTIQSLKMAALNLQEIHDLLVDVAHEAGRMMLAATPSYLSSGTKKNCTFSSSLATSYLLTSL